MFCLQRTQRYFSMIFRRMLFQTFVDLWIIHKLYPILYANIINELRYAVHAKFLAKVSTLWLFNPLIFTMLYEKLQDQVMFTYVIVYGVILQEFINLAPD